MTQRQSLMDQVAAVVGGREVVPAVDSLEMAELVEQIVYHDSRVCVRDWYEAATDDQYYRMVRDAIRQSQGGLIYENL